MSPREDVLVIGAGCAIVVAGFAWLLGRRDADLRLAAIQAQRETEQRLVQRDTEIRLAELRAQQETEHRLARRDAEIRLAELQARREVELSIQSHLGEARVEQQNQRVAGQPSELLEIRILTRFRAPHKIMIQHVVPSTTAAGMKARVQDILGIPPDQQRLMFAGQEIEDDRSIGSYGIQDGATLHLVSRRRGGMFGRVRDAGKESDGEEGELEEDEGEEEVEEEDNAEERYVDSGDRRRRAGATLRRPYAGQLHLGDISCYHAGLTAIIGTLPRCNLRRALWEEHCEETDSNITFDNSGILTTSAIEYYYVVNPPELPLRNTVRKLTALRTSSSGHAHISISPTARDLTLDGIPLTEWPAEPTEQHGLLRGPPRPLDDFSSELERKNRELEALREPPLVIEEFVAARLFTGVICLTQTLRCPIPIRCSMVRPQMPLLHKWPMQLEVTLVVWWVATAALLEIQFGTQCKGCKEAERFRTASATARNARWWERRKS